MTLPLVFARAAAWRALRVAMIAAAAVAVGYVALRVLVALLTLD